MCFVSSFFFSIKQITGIAGARQLGSAVINSCSRRNTIYGSTVAARRRHVRVNQRQWQSRLSALIKVMFQAAAWSKQAHYHHAASASTHGINTHTHTQLWRVTQSSCQWDKHSGLDVTKAVSGELVQVGAGKKTIWWAKDGKQLLRRFIILVPFTGKSKFLHTADAVLEKKNFLQTDVTEWLLTRPQHPRCWALRSTL